MPETWTPMPHQHEMLDWLDRPASLLWVGMGGGKTSVVLTKISELILEGAAKGALVVCPHRVILTWMAQVERWEHLNWLRVVSLRTEEGLAKFDRGEGDIFCLNSERLPDIERTVKGKTKKHLGFVSRHIKGKRSLPVDILVIDEISLAKNPRSRRFNALRPYLHDSDRYKTKFTKLIGLTGTPHSNSYADIFAPVRLVAPEVFGPSLRRFQHAFMEPCGYMGYQWRLQKGAKERIDAAVSDLALVIRSEDVLDLPPCTTIDIDVALPAKVKKKYDELERHFLLELEEGDVTALSAAALTQKLCQAAGGIIYTEDGKTATLHDAKLRELKKLRKKHKKEPLLVIGQYKSERARILEEFPEAVAFHEDHIPAWQRGEIPMLVAQYAQLAFGIDGMQLGGRILVIHTPTYSWEQYVQLVHRLLRPGQKHETLVYRLLAKDTIDWAVVSTLTEKKEGEKGLMAAVRNLQTLRKQQKTK